MRSSFNSLLPTQNKHGQSVLQPRETSHVDFIKNHYQVPHSSSSKAMYHPGEIFGADLLAKHTKSWSLKLTGLTK